MKNRNILVVIIILLIVFAIVSNKTDNQESDKLTIGAILPLSGPAAVWGENVKNGMELVLLDNPNIEVIYEDSKGSPADGVSAFHTLVTKNADIMLSALSTVSVPVSEVALQQKVPLLATLTATDNITNDYTIRYYNNATNFAQTSFMDPNSPLINLDKIAVVYRNDELGGSVNQQIQRLAAENNKEVVYSAAFNPGETDFSTMLLKIKDTDAEALLFTPVTPGEAVGIITKADELELNIPLIEASNVFADFETRKKITDVTFYSNKYNFSIDGNEEDFKNNYRKTYGKDPNFAAAYGYDVVNFIATCINEIETIEVCLRSIDSFDGVAGTATQIESGDFNIPLIFDKVN